MKKHALKQIIKENIFKILSESTPSNPKAIFLAGAPGAGKGYVLKGLNLQGLKILNVDEKKIEYLKQLNVSLDLKRANAEDRSHAAKAMAQATKDLKQQIPLIIENRESFILDGTAASFKNTKELKEELENNGYDTFMLYVYTDLERSLIQNQNRFEKSKGEDRSLNPSIVLRTWISVTQNYFLYQDLFKENFVSVANTLEDENLTDINQIIDKYIEPFSPQDTKPKTDKELEKSIVAKQKINIQSQELLQSPQIKQIIDNSVDRIEAQEKIASFLNK